MTDPDDGVDIVEVRRRLDTDLQRLVARALTHLDEVEVARFRAELDQLPTTYTRGLADAAAAILNEEETP